MQADLRSSPGERSRLEAFERLLRANGFPTRLMPGGEEVPYDVLLAGLSDAAGRTEWQLELSFVPGMEAELEGASLLQCFVHLPAKVPPAAEDELRRLVVRLNGRLPLVGFGWLDAERMACFRHTALLPGDDAAADEVVLQTAWMIGYLLSVFGAGVQAVAEGRLGFEEAIRDSAFRDVFE